MLITLTRENEVDGVGEIGMRAKAVEERTPLCTSMDRITKLRRREIAECLRMDTARR